MLNDGFFTTECTDEIIYHVFGEDDMDMLPEPIVRSIDRYTNSKI